MITVVSGLPRSGTSMMMQILHAGGLPALIDETRPADEHNPRGYYEFQKVRQLAADQSWVGDADGKVVKVVSQLLYHLPSQYEYRIIFMRRDLSEVLRSQEKMLAARQAPSGPEDQVMRDHFIRHLDGLEKWLGQQPNMQLFACNFSEMVADPARLAPRISSFLGVLLDPEKMAAAVDPSLYHQRKL